MTCVATTPPAAAPGPARVVVDLPQGLPSFTVSDPAGWSLVNYGEFSLRVVPAFRRSERVLQLQPCPLAIGFASQSCRRRAHPLFNLFHAKALVLDGRTDTGLTPAG